MGDVEKDSEKILRELEPVEEVKISGSRSSDTNIDLPFSRKAYVLLNQKNHVPELVHLFEQAHHVEHDQRHHVKVPENLAGTARHMLDGVLRQIARDEKRGKSNCGIITVKNIRQNMSKLHI